MAKFSIKESITIILMHLMLLYQYRYKRIHFCVYFTLILMLFVVVFVVFVTRVDAIKAVIIKFSNTKGFKWYKQKNVRLDTEINFRVLWIKRKQHPEHFGSVCRLNLFFFNESNMIQERMQAPTLRTKIHYNSRHSMH